MKNRVKDLQAKFVQIPREENKCADRLAKAASAKHMFIPNQVLSFVQLSPLIDNINLHKIGSESDWTTPITSYLKDGVLPDYKEAARKLNEGDLFWITVISAQTDSDHSHSTVYSNMFIPQFFKVIKS